jgi:IS4 transposase
MLTETVHCFLRMCSLDTCWRSSIPAFVPCGSSKNKKAPPVQLREVIFESPTQDGGVVRLLTTLLDVPADVIGLLYRYRWQVELFFRWLKCYANFDHLISHSRHGVQLQFYVVVVGMLLMYLHTGSRPMFGDNYNSTLATIRIPGFLN